MKPWLDDACSLAEAIRRRDVRAADALEASLEALAASKLNAAVYVDAEGARRQAEAVDAQIAAGKDIGPFGGVPLLVKELQDVAGWPSTQARSRYKDNIAEHDSTHVARLRASGAVIVGKTAASEFGLVAYTATKLHGVTRNPWNLERTPAGSSGGSAAAVAGGLVPLATASDGGGSIRKPAAFCGLVGLKGTFGRIPRGPRAQATDRSRPAWGVLTRSVRDTARWFDVASGYDARDPFSLPRVDGWEAGLGTHDLRAAAGRGRARPREHRAGGRRAARRHRGGGRARRGDGHAARRCPGAAAGGRREVGERGGAGSVQRPEGRLARLRGRPDLRDTTLDEVDIGAVPHVARGIRRPLPRCR